MHNLLILIVSHLKNLNKCELINSTYGKQLVENNIPYFFVSGDTLPYKNFIKLDHLESYEQLPIKTFLMLDNIKNKKFDFILKLNDDTLIDVKKLLSLNLKNCDYAGKFNNAKNKKGTKIHFYKVKNSFFYKDKKLSDVEWAEGGFYFLNKKAINKILSLKKDYFINTPENYRGEDEIIGSILKKFTKMNLKDEKLSKELHMDICRYGLSFHPVHTLIFEALHNAASLNDKIQILKNKYYLNEYFLRDQFLKKYE
jgi:hypothetical protein